MVKELYGTATPLVTPFDPKTYAIVEEELRKEARYCVRNGIHNVMVAGSAGEFVHLSQDERKRIFDVVIDEVNGKVPVIACTHSTSTDEAVMYTKYAKDAGADAVMLVHPYYYMINTEELYGHYAAIAKVGLPIMVYNNPWTSKIDMKPELLAKLAEDFPEIQWYTKECSRDVARVHDVLIVAKGKVRVFAGMDDSGFEGWAVGATGWVVGMAQIAPRWVSECFNAYMRGDIEKSKKIYFRLVPLMGFIEASPRFVSYNKAAMELCGILKPGPPRRPLLPLNNTDRERLKEKMIECGILDKCGSLNPEVGTL